MEVRSMILVEGDSDRGALEALARRLGRDLSAEGVAVRSMDGATNLGRHLARYGPAGAGLKVAGLCDAREERGFVRALRRAGIGNGSTRADLERLGFFVCVEDLEDELIRALGSPAVEAVLEAEHELDAFRTMQHQPAWRSRAEPEQLRRFLGAGSGRKIRMAPLLVDALDLERVPEPLASVLVHVAE